MSPADYRTLTDDFRRNVGAQPLPSLLETTALACEEAKAGLIRAGDLDDVLIGQLTAIGMALRARAEAMK